MASNRLKIKDVASKTATPTEEDDSVVYVYDRRKGSEPEKRINLGGVFDYHTFKDRIRREFGIGLNTHFVITSTNRQEIKDSNDYEELVDDGDTLYILNHISQVLPAPALERVHYLPHYDTLVKSGMYEYYASEGQNPLPFAFAELIDNSLAATIDNLGPRSIELRLFLDDSGDKSLICVNDNGKGMTSKQLNNWAIYRLSKFIRNERKHKRNDDDDEVGKDNVKTSHTQENVPRSLNSDISYFGVGGKQAIFFIGHASRMITKPKDSRDVHELTISKEEFERREKNKESIYSGFISNRPVGDHRHLDTDDQNLKNLISEESGRESFTSVVISGVNSQHVQYLKHDCLGWCRQLAHIYHYYIHGPRGNEVTLLGNKRPMSPFKHIDINVVIHERAKNPRSVNLRDIADDMQTKYIRCASDAFEFRAVVEGTGIVEGILRYHPFLYEKETYPLETEPRADMENLDDGEYYNEDRPARGNRPIFECYWNGRLIPYTYVDNFDWCAAPKKRGSIPIECYNRISGVLWTNDKFEVSTNKLTFMDLEVRLRDKNTIFQKVVLGQAQRVKIDRQFTEWLKECHESFDKQVKFCDFQEAISRPELTVKRQQSPWAVYRAIEWEGRVFSRGQLVRTTRTVPILTGTINRFLLFGHQEGDVYATGGEMEIAQEPMLLYNEVRTVPLSKLDRSANDRILRKYIEGEEGKLPEKLVISWPDGCEIKQGDRNPAGCTVGAIQVDIKNRKGETISRLPGSHLTPKKLLVELKVIWHAPNGPEELVTHLSQYVKTWGYWFKRMENMKNLGNHTIKIHVVLNESGVVTFGGKPLPSHKIKFTVTEAPPSKFSVGLLDPPFKVGVPFTIPLELQDEFNHPTKPVPDMEPLLEASGLELSYDGVQARGTTLLVQNVTAIGDVTSFSGKNFNLKITLPGLKFPTQTMKIRLAPGQPASIHVPTFNEDVVIENGQALTVNIEIRDAAGNITIHPKLNVVCKFLGAPSLPTYSGDCSSGKTTLTGNIIYLKNLKRGQKLTSRVSLTHFPDIEPVIKVFQVQPNSNPYYMDIWCKEGDSQFKFRQGQEIMWPAGDYIRGLVFVLYDEGGRQIKITPELASKVKVSWQPRVNQERAVAGVLPDIKVPSSAADSKYAQVSLSDGSGVEFGFTIKPEPGEVAQIKCVCPVGKKMRLGQTLEGDVIVNVTDVHGNTIKKVPHGALSHLEVTGEGLKTKLLQKVILSNTGFALRQVRFNGGVPGVRELCVRYHDFTDYVKLVVVAGPPTKIAFVDTSLYEPLSMYTNTKLDKNLVVQLRDDQDNPTSDANVRMSLAGSPGLTVTGAVLQTKADKDGLTAFGRPTIAAPRGHHKLIVSACLGRTSLQASIAVAILPDPMKLASIQVHFNSPRSLIVGKDFINFDIHTLAEDGSVFMKLNPKNVLLQLWKVDLSLPAPQQMKPPHHALCYLPDPEQPDDKPGHFYYRKRKTPETAGQHNITFQAGAVNQNVVTSKLMTFNIVPGPPVRLAPDVRPPTFTVSNSQKSQSRSLVKELKLQLKDQYNNAAGSTISGKVVVSLRGDSDSEVPMLVGNHSRAEFNLTKGVAVVENLNLEESTPGRDGCEYIMRVEVESPMLRQSVIEPYDQLFLFYNDARKQHRMAQLTKERDTLQQAISVFQSVFQTRDKLVAEMKCSVEEACQTEEQIRGQLKKFEIMAAQINSTESVRSIKDDLQKQRAQMVNARRRSCGLTVYVGSNNDPAVLGKVGQLADVDDDAIAHILSWHLLSDMDCVITKTSDSAMRIYQETKGHQQVLPIDSIHRKALPDWTRELPHLRFLRNYKPSGNPIFARDLLLFQPAHEDSCKLVFGMLLGDTIFVDSLKDAADYRKEVVKVTNCPTLLTRDGNRIRSNGKFGGSQNQCISPDKLKGAVFGTPVPDACHQLTGKIELLESLLQAIEKRSKVVLQLEVQETERRSKAMQSKRRECQEAREQLVLIENKLGMSSPRRLPPPALESSTPDKSPSPLKRVRTSSRSPAPSVVEGSPGTRCRTPLANNVGGAKRRR